MSSLRRARPRARHARRRVWARALVPGVLVALVGSSAFAYWGSGGAGGGGGTTASSVAVTLSPGVATAGLRPDGVGDVVVQVSNPNSYVAELGSLALDVTQGDGGYGVDAEHTDCALATLNYTTQSNGGAGWAVPAASGGDDGSLSITLSDALGMGADAANACQGATLTVYLTAGA